MLVTRIKLDFYENNICYLACISRILSQYYP